MHLAERDEYKADNDRLIQEVALRCEEIRIKDVRMAQLDPLRRPHYPCTERMAYPTERQQLPT